MEGKVHSITGIVDEVYKGNIELELIDTEPKGTESEGEPSLSHKQQWSPLLLNSWWSLSASVSKLGEGGVVLLRMQLVL